MPRVLHTSPSKNPESCNPSQLIEHSAWANDLTPADKKRVVESLSIRSFQAGATVVSKGERVTHWIGVVSGLVKINAVSVQGRSATFTGVHAGGWLGEGSLLKEEPRRYDVAALRDSTIAFLPKATFVWLLNSSIGFNRHLLAQLNERLSQFIAMVEYDRLLGPDAKVARCLSELFNPTLYPGTGRRLEITQEEIGYLCGISRQRVNQALKTLERAELVHISYRAVEVFNVEKLRSFVG
jgi:CRP/FNR family transcriptional regulator, cyclic AMP receptor protein